MKQKKYSVINQHQHYGIVIRVWVYQGVARVDAGGGNENTDREKQMDLRNVQKTTQTSEGEEKQMRYRSKVNCHKQLERMS